MEVVDLAKVELMMKRVIELDGTFFWGGAHLFYGIYPGRRSPQLGGDPERSKKHLQRIDEINDGRFLLSELFLAAYSIQDRDLYQKVVAGNH